MACYINSFPFFFIPSAFAIGIYQPPAARKAAELDKNKVNGSSDTNKSQPVTVLPNQLSSSDPLQPHLQLEDSTNNQR